MLSFMVNGQQKIETLNPEVIFIAVLNTIQDIVRNHKGILTANNESFNNSTLVHKMEIVAGDNTEFIIDIYSV